MILWQIAQNLWERTEERRRHKRFWPFAAALSVATALLGLFVALGIAQGASIFYFPLVTGIVIINTAVAILLSEWFLKRFYNL